MSKGCPHDRKVNLSVKLRDDNLSFTWPNGVVTQGETPRLGGLIDSMGYLDMNVCVDCHVVLDMLPVGYLLAKMPLPVDLPLPPWTEDCQLCGSKANAAHLSTCPVFET